MTELEPPSHCNELMKICPAQLREQTWWDSADPADASLTSNINLHIRLHSPTSIALTVCQSEYPATCNITYCSYGTSAWISGYIHHQIWLLFNIHLNIELNIENSPKYGSYRISTWIFGSIRHRIVNHLLNIYRYLNIKIYSLASMDLINLISTWISCYICQRVDFVFYTAT